MLLSEDALEVSSIESEATHHIKALAATGESVCLSSSYGQLAIMSCTHHGNRERAWISKSCLHFVRASAAQDSLLWAGPIMPCSSRS